MNCSDFERELDLLVETRGADISGPGAAHAAECQQCRTRWAEHRLLERAVSAWKVIPAVSMVDAVLEQCTETVLMPPRVPPSTSRGVHWAAVAMVAACLLIVVGIGVIPSPDAGPGSHGATNEASVSRAEPIEVASSVAAVLDDFRTEYRDMAAETSATARDLAGVIPVASVSTWSPAGFADPLPGAVSSNDLPEQSKSPGAVTEIGRSIGTQLVQAIDFLRVAVPDDVPAG
jgi:hypothetical protein